MDSLNSLRSEVSGCRPCPRLVEWREAVAADPPKRHAGETYWARPALSFGDPTARLVVVGLAPAAQGGNRTGRIFTGDRSGDWLFASMHRTGWANQPESISLDDGLELRGAWVTAVVRCAPPANRPTTAERDTCIPYLERELRLLEKARVLLALGGFAWDGILRALAANGIATPRPKPKFAHAAEAQVGSYTLLGCFHPSQQNTFTGRLTEPMTDAVFERARALSG